jgi:hypothetical protein
MNADIIEQFFSAFVKPFLVGGSGAAFVWILFKSFGENWLSHQFNKKMEAFKTDLYLLSARHKKLQDKEHEVFPEMWEKLMIAKRSLSNSIYSYQHMPDFEKMSEDQISEWINSSDLDQDEKQYFIAEPRKIEAYSRILNHRSLREAGKNIVEFRIYTQNNSIFLSPDIKEKIIEIENNMVSVKIAKDIDLRSPELSSGQDDFLVKAYKKFNEEVLPSIKELEGVVQKKLFPEND